MNNPCIIGVAITGSLPQKHHNPAVPITSTSRSKVRIRLMRPARAWSLHVRNDDGTPSADPLKFEALLNGIRQYCPDMIVQFSTGGRSGAGRERGAMISLQPDMASLAVGSNNFPTRVYDNPPDLVDWLAAEMLAHNVMPEIEAFDLSHIHQAVLMKADGRLKPLCTYNLSWVSKTRCRQIRTFLTTTSKRSSVLHRYTLVCGRDWAAPN